VNVVHSSSQRRGERRREREAKMLEAAAAIVASDGMEALSLHRLARELGYVPAALYRYFASKDALIAALQRRAVAAMHAEFRKVCELAEADAAKRSVGVEARALLPILAAARFYLQLPETAPEHFRLVSLLLADPRPLVGDAQARSTAPVLLAFLGDVGELLERAVSAGALSLGDSLDRTLVLWSSLQGIAQLGKLARFDKKRFATQRLGEHAVGALLLGWGASSGALLEASSPGRRRPAPRSARSKP
jgi:AcrR family transcriptional regulator